MKEPDGGADLEEGCSPSVYGCLIANVAGHVIFECDGPVIALLSSSPNVLIGDQFTDRFPITACRNDSVFGHRSVVVIPECFNRGSVHR